jgi:hypothetical protein
MQSTVCGEVKCSVVLIVKYTQRCDSMWGSVGIAPVIFNLSTSTEQ